jgi:hypothetical protein
MADRRTYIACPLQESAAGAPEVLSGLHALSEHSPEPLVMLQGKCDGFDHSFQV